MHHLLLPTYTPIAITTSTLQVPKPMPQRTTAKIVQQPSPQPKQKRLEEKSSTLKQLSILEMIKAATSKNIKRV